MDAVAHTQPDTTKSFFLEGDAPNLPLVISFGFYDVNNNPQFDFYGRLKKLAQVSGRPTNCLYLRDPQQSWYLHGIAGLGDTVDATVTALSAIIEKLAPSHVTTIGQSMGAYAAILYGTLLNVDKVIAFGPLSCFDSARWQLMGERRWEAIRQRVVASGGSLSPYDDLPTLLQGRSGKRPSIDLLYGMSPDDTSVPDSIGYDVAHAMRFEALDTVRLLPVPAAPHAIVEYLRKNGVITEVIRHCLYNDPLDERIASLTEPHGQWVTWLEENLQRGSTLGQLTEVMQKQAMDEALIRELVDRVGVRRGLQSIAARTRHLPVVTKAPYDPDDEEELHACCSDPRHQHR